MKRSEKALVPTVLLAAWSLLAGSPAMIEAQQLNLNATLLKFSDTAEVFTFQAFSNNLSSDSSIDPNNFPFSSFGSNQWSIGISGGVKVVNQFDRTSLAGVFGVPSGSPFWSIQAELSTDFVINPDGSLAGIENARLSLSGTHIEGPDSADDDPNPLPAIFTKALSADVGQTFRAKTKREKVTHDNPDLGPAQDRYGLRSSWTVVRSTVADRKTVLKPVLDKNGVPITILATHRRGRRTAMVPDVPDSTGMTLGASGSFAFFDAATGTLTMSSNQIDAAELVPSLPSSGGSGSGSANSQSITENTTVFSNAFENDPLLTGLSFIRVRPTVGNVDQLPYLGFDAGRQLHVFSGGTLEILNSSAGFTFEAVFDEMLYEPVSGDFFTLFSRVDFTDIFDTAPSDFLDQLTDAHLFEEDPSSGGMMFKFNLPGLAQATNNFTKTFFPSSGTTFFVTGVLVPEPGTLVLLAPGVFPLIRRRHAC